MTPIKIDVKDKQFLVIEWDDDTVSNIKLANLRKECPCALCKAEKDEQSASYIPIYGDEQLTITNLEIVGQYALKIAWKDGHETGLYEYGFLKKLSD